MSNGSFWKDQQPIITVRLGEMGHVVIDVFVVCLPITVEEEEASLTHHTT